MGDPLKDVLALGTPAATLARQERGAPDRHAEVRDLARSLLDQEYFENLSTRLKAGLCAPGLEVAVWRYAFGDPKADMNERAHEVARFEAIREQVRQRIKAGAGLVDARAQGARRVLTLTPQPEPDTDGSD